MGRVIRAQRKGAGSIFQSNYLDNKVYPAIEYKRNAIRIEYGTRSFGEDRTVQFRYRLHPDPVWSDFTTSTVKEYNNLKEDDYTFEVEALCLNGETAVTRFSFTILPPWYRSVYAWIDLLVVIGYPIQLSVKTISND